MSKNDTYFVLHFLNGAPQSGDVPKPDNPDDLHVTFLAHISAPDRFSGEIMLAFYDAADAANVFTLTPNGYEKFGKYGQHKVITLADDDGKAKDLHNDLLERVMKIRGTDLIQPNYAGEFYSPHITVLDDNHELTLGAGIPISSLTLVRHIGGLNGEIEVLASVSLSA